MAFDLSKYGPGIRAALAFAAELAKLTGNTWDDGIVAQARALVELFLGPESPAAGLTSGAAVGHAVELEAGARGLPAWLAPILASLVKRLLGF